MNNNIFTSWGERVSESLVELDHDDQWQDEQEKRVAARRRDEEEEETDEGE